MSELCVRSYYESNAHPPAVCPYPDFGRGLGFLGYTNNHERENINIYERDTRISTDEGFVWILEFKIYLELGAWNLELMPNGG